MSVFGGLVLTNNGRNLFAKAQTGKLLNFKRIVLGDGQLGSSESMINVLQLKNEILSCNILDMKIIQNEIAKITFVISNQELLEGFYWRELGIIAEDPDTKEEVLYCYGNARENGEYISAKGGEDILEKHVSIDISISNVENVSAIIDESLVFVSKKELQLFQQQQLDDMSKTYTGTNITGPTVEGYGTIHKLYGNTIEEGTGEKSPSNPYALRCVGDLIAISNEKMEQGTISSSTGQDSPNDSRVRTKSFIELGAGNYKLSYSGVNDYIILQYTLSGEFVRATNWLSLNVFSLAEKSKLRFVFRKNDTDAITPNDILNLEIIKAIEIISQNGDQQSSNIVVTKPLCCLKDGDNVVAQDWIDYTRGVVHRECGYVVLDGNTNISYMDTSNNTARFMVALDNVKSITTYKCDKLKVLKQSEAGDEECVIIRDLSSDNTVNIRVKRDRLSEVSTAGIKNYLSSNPITLIYQLATPTTEPLDCSNKIVQYADETTVSNRDNAEIEVSLTNNKAISEVNEDIGSLQEKVRVVDLISKIVFNFSISENRSQFKKVNNVYNMNLFIGSNTAFNSDTTIATIPVEDVPNGIEFLQYPVMLQDANSQVIGIGRASINSNGQISLHHNLSNVYRIVLWATYIK